MQLGAEDLSGRPAPEAVPHSEFLLRADQVVKAIGQKKPALAALLGLRVNGGFIAVDERFEMRLGIVFALPVRPLP